MKKVLLSCIEYSVIEADKQIIFKCNDGMSNTEFAFEWTGCGWYLVALDDQWEKVFAPHIVAAFAWVESNYEITYFDGVGKASLK